MTVSTDLIPVSFAKVIAIMAYVMAIAQAGPGVFEGAPYILPALLGEKDEIGR